MCKLTRLYAENVLMPETIMFVDNNLYQLSFQHQGQLDDENLDVGSGTCGVLAELEEGQDVKSFLKIFLMQ